MDQSEGTKTFHVKVNNGEVTVDGQPAQGGFFVQTDNDGELSGYQIFSVEPDKQWFGVGIPKGHAGSVEMTVQLVVRDDLVREAFIDGSKVDYDYICGWGAELPTGVIFDGGDV